VTLLLHIFQRFAQVSSTECLLLFKKYHPTSATICRFITVFFFSFLPFPSIATTSIIFSFHLTFRSFLLLKQGFLISRHILQITNITILIFLPSFLFHFPFATMSLTFFPPPSFFSSSPIPMGCSKVLGVRHRTTRVLHIPFPVHTVLLSWSHLFDGCYDLSIDITTIVI
jgi:hypothetical protein